MNKIIDCFIYSGEKDILEIRLNEHNIFSDYFVIVESKFTQSGLDKPYYFEQHSNLFKGDILNKVVYIKFDNYTHDESDFSWSHEIRTRNAINLGLNKIINDISVNDIVLISDCDEVINKNSINQLFDINFDIISFNHYFIAYYLNLYAERSWYGTVATKVGVLRNILPNDLRGLKDNINHIENGGWHFSGICGLNFDILWNKYKNCIEPKNKSFLVDQNKENLRAQFNKCVYEDKHFFFCDAPDKRTIPLKKLDINLLPEYVKNNREKFKHLIYD